MADPSVIIAAWRKTGNEGHLPTLAQFAAPECDGLRGNRSWDGLSEFAAFVSNRSALFPEAPGTITEHGKAESQDYIRKHSYHPLGKGGPPSGSEPPLA
jgi:hypothetical protein